MRYLGRNQYSDSANRPNGQRKLRIESLEQREMLSVTLTDLPEPNYEPSETVLMAPMNFAQTAATSPIQLAPPTAARVNSETTLSTVTVHWNAPVKTSTLNVDEITHFKVVLKNTVTKEEITILTDNADARSVTFKGLNPKTRYEITVTSCGDPETTSSSKATLKKFTATTDTFPVPTLKASDLTMSSATISVTDRDKVTPFEDGKTVKTYTIEYIARTTGAVNWSKADSIVIEAGTLTDDSMKVSTILTGLKAETQYYFRVITTYTESGTELEAVGRQMTFRTQKLPTTTITAVSYTLVDNDLGINVTGRMTNSQTLGNTPVSYQLLVSLGSTTDRSTGKLNDSHLIDLASFGKFDSTGRFSLTEGVSLSSIAQLFGSNSLLGSKSITFQLVANFDLGSSNIATAYSRVSKLTMPSWYTA